MSGRRSEGKAVGLTFWGMLERRKEERRKETTSLKK